MCYMLGYNLTTRGKHARVIKQRSIVKTPSAWDEHDLLWSIQILGVFHRRHCLKVQLPRHIHWTLLVVVSIIVTLAASSCHLADLRLIHTIPDTTCLPTARASLLSLWIWNVKWLGMILSERSKDSNPVYLVLPSRRDCLFCEIRRNKRCWLNPGHHTCGNDMRAW